MSVSGCSAFTASFDVSSSYIVSTTRTLYYLSACSGGKQPDLHTSTSTDKGEDGGDVDYARIAQLMRQVTFTCCFYFSICTLLPMSCFTSSIRSGFRICATTQYFFSYFLLLSVITFSLVPHHTHSPRRRHHR